MYMPLFIYLYIYTCVWMSVSAYVGVWAGGHIGPRYTVLKMSYFIFPFTGLGENGAVQTSAEASRSDMDDYQSVSVCNPKR